MSTLDVIKGVTYNISTRFFLLVPALIMARHHGMTYGICTAYAFLIALSICEDGSLLFDVDRVDNDFRFYLIMAFLGNALYSSYIFFSS
jgi:hypothetical protein